MIIISISLTRNPFHHDSSKHIDKKIIIFMKTYDTPPSSLMDSFGIPKVLMEGEGIGARSLVRNTSKVKKHVGVLGWD